MNLLKFSPGKGNAKLQLLGGEVYTFSLLSGWACPGAKECYSRAVVETDHLGENRTIHIEDGPDTQFRCFSATQEVVYGAVYNQRKHNFDTIKAAMRAVPTDERAVAVANLIQQSLPSKATVIRIHVAGDFFLKEYMEAWLIVAKNNPGITFYAYTKSIHFWVELMSEIPNNMKLNASKGGKFDHLIDAYKLKYAEVVYTEQEAIDKGLEIDHDDAHAFLQDNSFALLLHGVQPKGSDAAEALKLLKKAGIGQYTKTKTKKDVTTRKNKLETAAA
jgi:hypothetical protein